jgi:hypothetical protein
MRNPGIELQRAYYEALSVNPVSIGDDVWSTTFDEFGLSTVVWGGYAVPVISDIVPESLGFDAYIVLGEQTFVDDADKQAFGAEATQRVTVVTSFQSDRGGKKLATEIADLVMQRIRVRARLPMIGFNMITSTLDSYLTLMEPTGTSTLIRVELRFRHIIEQIEQLDVAYLTDNNGTILTDNNGNYLTP